MLASDVGFDFLILSLPGCSTHGQPAATNNRNLGHYETVWVSAWLPCVTGGNFTISVLTVFFFKPCSALFTLFRVLWCAQLVRVICHFVAYGVFSSTNVVPRFVHQMTLGDQPPLSPFLQFELKMFWSRNGSQNRHNFSLVNRHDIHNFQSFFTVWHKATLCGIGNTKMTAWRNDGSAFHRWRWRLGGWSLSSVCCSHEDEDSNKCLDEYLDEIKAVISQEAIPDHIPPVLYKVIKCLGI